MTVPNTNVSMFGVGNEKNIGDFDDRDDTEVIDDGGLSLRGLSDDNFTDGVGGSVENDINQASTNKPDQSPPHGLGEFRGYDHNAVAFAWANDTLGLGNAPFNVADSSSSTSTVAIHDFGFSYQSNNHRVRMRLQKSNGTGNGGMATASFITFADYNSSLTDPDSVEAKCNWNGVFTGHETGTGDSFEPSNASFGGNWQKNTYKTIGTSTSDGSSGFTTGRWQVKRGSNLGSAFYKANSATSGQDSPAWTIRAKDSNGNVLDESGSRTSNSSTFQLTATRSSPGGGPGGGGGGGIVCIHEDHLVQTENGLMHINDIVETDPKVYGYNTATGQIELADLIEIRTVKHDNLYIINDTKVTEDHILYADGYRPVSVKPDITKTNYGKDSEEIKVGDKLMKYDGSLEEVTSIEVLEGKHKTYTIKTELGNFYANDILVDSEI